MTTPSSYHKERLEKLHVLKHDLSELSQIATAKLLEELSGADFRVAANYKAFYNTLLFLLAYPANAAIHSLAEKALSRMTLQLQNNKALARQLFNSGIPGTFITGSFSYCLNRSLLENNGENISLHSVDGDKELVMQFLYPAFSGIEREMLSEEPMSWKKWMKCFAGNDRRAQLAFFIQQLGKAVTGVSAREAAFASFKLFTRIKLENDPRSYSQTTGRYSSVYYHNKGLSKTSMPLIFDTGKKIISPVLITAANKIALVQLAQRTIFAFFKETDPFTFAQIAETEYFTCDRGISIALFYMHPEKKLELECYCGYLLLKNNVPVAYGGGWVLGHQCRFGLNILPAFRGGESALLTVRLMNLFVQHFNVRSIIIDPFQLGKGNADGIRSASFWFYYKMGFRPMQPALSKLAAAEYKKLGATKPYRTPAAVLKELSGSVMRLQAPAERDLPYFDINAIGLAVVSYIKKNCGNDRGIAESRCYKKHPLFKKKLPLSVMLLADAVTGGQQLNDKELTALAGLFKLKVARERDFVLGLQKQHKFLELIMVAVDQ